MKMNDVKIGGEYEARIAGGTMQVRILAEKAFGGWSALNLATKKKVFVPLARQLREPSTLGTTTTTEGNLTVIEVPPATVETINAAEAKPARAARRRTRLCYASILREINTKGKDARFKKVDRGQFIATGSEA